MAEIHRELSSVLRERNVFSIVLGKIEDKAKLRRGWLVYALCCFNVDHGQHRDYIHGQGGPEQGATQEGRLWRQAAQGDKKPTSRHCGKPRSSAKENGRKHVAVAGKGSVSRNRQPSQTRERITWEDILKKPKMPERLPSAKNAAVKALRAENEQLKQKIAYLEHANKSINAKLDRLQQQPQQPQPAPPQPQLSDQRPAELVREGSVPEQDPRAHQREREPTTKRRALEPAKDQKILA
ncbi:hypothetical protein HPB48_005765 [Haemaphysalis longicornis]|uniref:Uncharacterized protein n=1 Tax=Haemaphysalis longicornis TaxID=44386 RepID=A0A9J6GWE5_HAELO|nr:hypothetical protein HPB48_005765 [Haemaphysalis longicornis]